MRRLARKPERPSLLATAVVVLLITALGVVLNAASASAATPATLDLRVLLVGDGPTDPTTAAWAAALTQEGVPYTEVDATGAYGSETVPLPALSAGNTAYFNGVVIADSPAGFAAGQLTALDAFESAFGVRQIDGYTYPDPALGLTVAGGGALDGTTATLTAAGLAGLPALAGSVAFGAGTYGYPATVVSGAPFTPWLVNAAGQVLAGVYQHPSAGDPQPNVSELALTFDYAATFRQFQVLAPGLIDWVTQDTHLGEYRNYVEMDIDDTFTPDNAWSTTLHDNDYSDADSMRMNAADVTYAAQWSAANDFRMDQLYNGGGSVEYQDNELDLPTSGPDPVLARFQATDPATGKPYADDFGWLSHTYDTPYLDVGCATQNYIEAELNENTNWAAAAPGTTPGTGGLGLTETTDTAAALGTENPQVFVPGNHSGFADLDPGTPSTVDPPDLDEENVNASGGTLAAGTYEYAVTDQFTDSATAGQSQAYVTAPLTVPAGGSVSLVWQAICHAANYLVYREVAGSNDWSLVGTDATPDSATLPDNSSGDPTSTTDVTNGGQLELTYTDTGAAGTAQPAGWTPPITENAQEAPWEQNPYFVPALEAVGITAVGADASKAYPNPPDGEFGIGASYTGPTYAAGQTFLDGTAQAVPRHPINVFYNASTEAQEVDEYNTLYTPVADGGQCVPSATTTCETAPLDFAQITDSVVSGMFTSLLSNNPEPSYVHQTNIMGQPPAGPATTGTPPNTADTTGDGLLYSVLNPLLAEYHQYFNANTPYVQLTLGAIGTTLAEQAAWSASQSAASPAVTAAETNGVVTIANAGTTAATVPVTVPPGTTGNGSAFGAAYGGQLSGWQTVAAGGSATLTETVAPSIISAAAANSIVGAPFSVTVAVTGAPTPALTESGALPTGLTFTDNGNGTATIAGTPAAGTGGVYPLTITAASSAGRTTQSFTLTNAQAPTITSPATATFTAGIAGTYTVTTTGYPAPTLTESGTLPSGLTFVDNGNGVATLAGTPASGSTGTYPVTISATNSSGSTATLALTITVAAPAGPTITNAGTAYFTLGTAGAFAVTATGTPTPAVTETGALPAGLTFTDEGNGEALLSGTPTATGTTDLTITVTNAVGSSTQTLSVVVGSAPAITGPATAAFVAGSAGSATVTTTGYPAPALTESGALPAGLSFVDNHNGTATVAGTPAAGTGGTYPVTITAVNGTGTVTAALTITVAAKPVFTSGTTVTAHLLRPVRFTVTTTALPTATITSSRLPLGLRFTANSDVPATISGTPLIVGRYTVTLTAKNSAGTTTQILTITITL